MYVTDGGHYENLGLVELVRRQCKWIWCVDASGDKQDTFSTIAGAVRLARDELGVEIEIDPTTMAPDPTVTADRARRGLKPVVQSPFCRGSIVYADGSSGTLVVIKAGVPADAPLGIAEFYKDNPAFPCDSTIHQLYTADRFDAYRELGYLCADEALVKLIDELTNSGPSSGRSKAPEATASTCRLPPNPARFDPSVTSGVASPSSRCSRTRQRFPSSGVAPRARSPRRESSGRRAQTTP